MWFFLDHCLSPTKYFVLYSTEASNACERPIVSSFTWISNLSLDPLTPMRRLWKRDGRSNDSIRAAICSMDHEQREDPEQSDIEVRE